MHPSINFDNQEVKSAFEQQQRETRHAWWLPLVLLLGIALELYFAEQPETFETEHYLFALIISGIGIYSLYALWIYYRDSKFVPITQPLQKLQRRNQWVEHFYGAVTLTMISLSVVTIVFNDGSLWEIAKDEYPLWLYTIVFAVMYIRKRRRKHIEESDVVEIDWQKQAIANNTNIITGLRWLLPAVAGTAIVMGMVYYYGYGSDWVLGVWAGLLFVMATGTYKYLNLK
jgi:hypothetical protein